MQVKKLCYNSPMITGIKPPKAVIIAIGRELLTGRVMDRNTNFLAAGLFDLGWFLMRACMVDDDGQEVCGALSQAMRDGAKLVITTGGLGPTYDDGTLNYIGNCLNLPVEPNPTAQAMVKERYEQVSSFGVIKGGNLNRARMKMAWLPKTALPMKNTVGTAPGSWLEYENVIIASLPGPPREMQAMFQQQVVPKISEFTNGHRFIRKRLTLPQPDESLMDPLITKARDKFPTVYFKTVPKRFATPQMDVVMETYGMPDQAQSLLNQASTFLYDLFSESFPT